MATLERLGPDDLKAVVTTYRDALRAHQAPINRLNVYPVPDGDTGTNMALTLESVVAGLDGTSGMPDVCQAISRGSLMGARGNSGVILSQILRGIADGCREHADVGAPELAKALSSASDAAYAAVMRPVEGTILTVVKAAAGGAATSEGSLCGMFDAAKAAGATALANTPEQLPVLKQAGVVDAGGAGFQLLLDAFLHVVDGRPLPEPEDVESAPAIEYTPEIDAAHDSVSDLRYEVMYFLEAPDETVPHFKNVWAGIGDSIVVVGGDGLWNCHIHTDDIGAAVEAALDAGRPRNIRVTDLLEQVEEERWVREAAVPEDEPDLEPVPTAVVAVATGEGIRRIFRSLGVQQIVSGGQSMNPSTEQLLTAVQAAPADEVVILPNNKNIIPVAEQVDTLTDKTVRVVKTRGIAQGFAALLEYDPESTGDENAKAMEAAAGRVVAGEVTRAVRASTCDLGPIAEGDYLGITDDGIRAIAPGLADAVTGLLDVLVTDDHEIVTLIEGEGATAADTRRVTEWVHDNRPDASVEVHHGGQPLYPYLVSIE
ncbi:MAG: DAK2 domain-containing protein [Actinobacteria bacterium]|nr:DAK2 domain-containing protein [Actinomycetota bacterium]MBV8960128.1 DAK2 domain-containing protein [Actinomycetota bacterium]